MNPSIAFVICTEKGYLERMSVLFAKSLRTFGGKLKDVPIYSYAPRIGHNISSWASKQFDALGVIHQHIPLNQEFRHYAISNKVFALSHAEATLDYDILVFADSDKLVLSEPTALLLPPQYDIALTPVGSKGIGIRDKNDTEYEYWQRIYEVCKVDTITYVKTTIDLQQIQGYWNSGLIAARPKKMIFSQWEINLLKILRNKIYPKNGLYFTEQSTFSATVMGTKARIFDLPKNYNYSIHRQDSLSASQKIEKLADIVTVHYHDMFRTVGKYSDSSPLSSFINSDPQQYEWLMEHLDKYGVYHLNYPKRLYTNAYGWITNKIQRIQERIYF